MNKQGFKIKREAWDNKRLEHNYGCDLESVPFLSFSEKCVSVILCKVCQKENELEFDLVIFTLD